MNINFKENILKSQELEELLGSFYQATGLYSEAVDKEGHTFFIPGNVERCEFCRCIRNNPNGEKKCQDSYKRATVEAAKWGEPYFVRCHAGLFIWAVPIVIMKMPVGSIILGQVLLKKPDKVFFQLLKKLNEQTMNFEQIKEKAGKIEVISPQRSQAAADMLLVVVNHLVKRDIYVLEQIDANKRMQQQIRSELEERKRVKSGEIDDDECYLKNERRFLRYIRLGDRIRANDNLPILLTDLFTKAAGDKATVKIRVLELAALTSRATVEGGADAKRVMSMVKEFHKEIEKMDKIEDFFHTVQTIVEGFLSDIFTLADKKHLSLLKDARNYILENYSHQLTINDVSKALFISPSHLCRLFRAELDTTINDYLTRVRVEKAVELMKQPELSVDQVAKAVGFSSQSYFTKVFRKYIGVTPYIYKNSLS